MLWFIFGFLIYEVKSQIIENMTVIDDQIYDSTGAVIEACMDIKHYLWVKHSDYTSLPSTMSIFAVIYSLIVT
uniref:Uncharacterized protein n=1 Tax=Panagrolaimus davidi TaxID=227884 RepID=A0A914PWZ8_9BILA